MRGDGGQWVLTYPAQAVGPASCPQNGCFGRWTLARRRHDGRMSKVDALDNPDDGLEPAAAAGTGAAAAADPVDAIDPAAPLHTDDDITHRVGLLIGRACRRQLWLLFLDERAVMLPTLMPNDELPVPLDDELAGRLAAMLQQAIAGTPIESVILVWERPGGPVASTTDRESAAALAWACADVGVPVRAQLISHNYGVRLFSPEEFSPVVDLAA